MVCLLFVVRDYSPSQTITVFMTSAGHTSSQQTLTAGSVDCGCSLIGGAGRLWAAHLSTQPLLSTSGKQFCPNCLWPLGEAGVCRLRRSRGGVSICIAMGEPLSMLGTNLPVKLFQGHPCPNPSPTALQEAYTWNCSPE